MIGAPNWGREKYQMSLAISTQWLFAFDGQSKYVIDRNGLMQCPETKTAQNHYRGLSVMNELGYYCYKDNTTKTADCSPAQAQ